MADAKDLFFFGDDFDVILDILEEEEELDEQLREAANEVSIILFLSQNLAKSAVFDVHLLSPRSGIISAGFFVATCVIAKSL